MASPQPHPDGSMAARGRSRKRTVGLAIYGVIAALIIGGAVFTSSRSAADAFGG